MARILALLSLLSLAWLLSAGEKEGPKNPSGLAGNWKVMLLEPRSLTLQPGYLLALENKEGKWVGKILAQSDRWRRAKLQKLVVDKETIRFDLQSEDATIACRLNRGTEKGPFRGTMAIGRNVAPVELERTTLTSLDPLELSKEKLAALPLGFEAGRVAIDLIRRAEPKTAKPDEVRRWADKVVRSADLYGPVWSRSMATNVAELLLDHKEYAPIAVVYARRAERGLEPKDPPVVQKEVLETLAKALEAAGKDDEAKGIKARLAKLDFRVKVKPFAGRKGKSERVVLVEVLSSAQSSRCAASLRAAEALEKTFKPTDAVVLRYYLPIDSPDPLANRDTMTRFRFYRPMLEGLPSAVFGGEEAIGCRGDMTEAQETYTNFVNNVTPLLEKPARAKVTVEATRKGDKVSIKATVGQIEGKNRTVRLRLALVEDEVAFRGVGGVEKHDGVVRELVGGPDGVLIAEDRTKEEKEEKPAKKEDKPVKKEDKEVKPAKKEGPHTFMVDLVGLRKKLTAYLDEVAKSQPFPSKARPMEFKKLRVVAFVQNERGEVLQAAQAAVKE